MALIAMAVLVGVAGLLMAGTWIWNFYLSRRKLDDAINDLKREITSHGEKAFEEHRKKAEEMFGDLSKTIESEVEKAKIEIGETVEQKVISINAETARLHARVAGQEKSWETCALWWSRAIREYARCGQDALLSVAVGGCEEALNECEKLEDKDREEIRDSLPYIPSTLFLKKGWIEKKLDELPKEIKKKPEKPKLVEPDGEED